MLQYMPPETQKQILKNVRFLELQGKYPEIEKNWLFHLVVGPKGLDMTEQEIVDMFYGNNKLEFKK